MRLSQKLIIGELIKKLIIGFSENKIDLKNIPRLRNRANENQEQPISR